MPQGFLFCQCGHDKVYHNGGQYYMPDTGNYSACQYCSCDGFSQATVIAHKHDDPSEFMQSHAKLLAVGIGQPITVGWLISIS